ncbi:N-acetylglucosamine-6-phosphate deacetylase [Clostridium sp. CF012]|uniref:N-acetylglucosamine-6-phosphate deacetylase n=1 Tax=Clostridium sp. CF012 TaxID=2843319 RepID=UPI001C0D1D91|nr:N-acetylglucosamine-6-phosphate deacetylase [Clostridium sp. CF012]MBU3144872.1 N-acetylglucosamine-6-phosphate deacetylase [Clostridium sp. CF012]
MSHIEGPYLNPKYKGMQNEKFLRSPNFNEVDRIFQEAGTLIKMVTIAPELPGAIELISYLKERNVIVSIANSDATYEQAKDAFACGASHITHCFNAMSPIHHRNPGIVVAAMEEEKVSIQAIVDNVHLHPAIVRLLHKIKGPDKLVLVTDALQAMGAGDGDYIFGGHNVTVEKGIARLKDGTLASSTITMNRALEFTVKDGISLKDAITMASETPANVIGLTSKGKLKEGYDADCVLIDNQYNVIWTMSEGKLIWGSV